ncbi:hypothetical protein CPC08DRAFT_816644 [Agrocybe pediades]|nr:hypothetical protein CPC08DRAFT_816644 [Agrocybe pediades]
MQEPEDTVDERSPSTDRNRHTSQQPLFSKLTRNLHNIPFTSIGSFFAPSSKKHDVLNPHEVWTVSHAGDLNPQVSAYSTGSSRPRQHPVNPEELDLNQLGITTDDCSLLPFSGEHGRISAHIDSIATHEAQDGRVSRNKGALNHGSHSRLAWARTGQPNVKRSRYTGSNSRHDVATASAPPVFVSSFPSPSTFGTYEDKSISSNETPPLTPDSLSFNNSHYVLPAIPSDSGTFCPLGFQYPFQSSLSSIFEDRKSDDSDDDQVVYLGPQLQEVKEGKKPERCPDDVPVQDPGASSAIAEDNDEWYGLEYTLELSTRERQPSNSTQSCSGGEHSKSRESWAAIHQGMIHPFFEDEDYHQWKNWHRFLDHQEEKKKHKKGYEFKVLSKDKAWLYVDEIRTRNVLYWQKEVFGVVARDVKDRLMYIVQRRPDPYFPPHKHNWSWYLKRSRSAACLRELKPRAPLH